MKKPEQGGTEDDLGRGDVGEHHLFGSALPSESVPDQSEREEGSRVAAITVASSAS